MSTQTPDLRTAAQAVIDRWETPLWKDAPATAGYIAALRDALAADHTEHHLEMVGRWYMVTQDGMATLCVDREDAEAEARKADRAYPRNGPHRAVQLVEAQATALAKPYCYEDCMAYTAGIEKELQDARAAARPTPTHLEAMERAWLWMENQADSQSKGGHATFDLMMLREERDALRAAIDAAPTTQPAPQQEAQEPVAGHCRFPGGAWAECSPEHVRMVRANPEEWKGYEVRYLYAEPQPSPAAQGDALDAARWHWLSEHIQVAWNEGKFTSLVRIVSEQHRQSLNASVDRMMAGDWSDAARAAQEGK